MSRSFVEKMQGKWNRLFMRRQPFRWEASRAAGLLRDVSQDAWACQQIAELLDIECDPGESAAPYVSEMLRQPWREIMEEDHEKSVAKLENGFIP